MVVGKGGGDGDGGMDGGGLIEIAGWFAVEEGMGRGVQRGEDNPIAD